MGINAGMEPSSAESLVGTVFEAFHCRVDHLAIRAFAEAVGDPNTLYSDTDKAKHCGYRDIPNNVVGASLYVWRDYFPNAEIFGVDNDGKFIFTDERIHTFQADAYSPVQMNAAMQAFGPEKFDFIVDDAVHDPVPQICLLNFLWPYLADDGIYAMEDVCPYKVPDGDMDNMLRMFPEDARTTIVSTHKDERLLLIRR